MDNWKIVNSRFWRKRKPAAANLSFSTFIWKLSVPSMRNCTSPTSHTVTNMIIAKHLSEPIVIYIFFTFFFLTFSLQQPSKLLKLPMNKLLLQDFKHRFFTCSLILPLVNDEEKFELNWLDQTLPPHFPPRLYLISSFQRRPWWYHSCLKLSGQEWRLYAARWSRSFHTAHKEVYWCSGNTSTFP